MTAPTQYVAARRPAQRQQRPGPADADGGPHDRRAQRARRQAAGVLRQRWAASTPTTTRTRTRPTCWRGSRMRIGYFDTALGLARRHAQQRHPFTASDFGRTFTTNGDGTDHGWGAHHFVDRRRGQAAAKSTAASRSSGSTPDDVGRQRLPAGRLGRPGRRDPRQVVRRQRQQSRPCSRTCTTSSVTSASWSELPKRWLTYARPVVPTAKRLAASRDEKGAI